MGIFDAFGKNFGQAFAATLVTRSSRDNRRYGAILAACAILPVFVPDIWMTILGLWNDPAPRAAGQTRRGVS